MSSTSIHEDEHFCKSQQLDISRHWRQAVGILAKRGGKFVCLRRNSKGSGLPTEWNKTENLRSGREALRHLDAGGNVGLAAGSGNLYIIDFDGEAERGHECAQLSGGLYFYRVTALHKAKFVFTCPDKIPTRIKSKQYGIDLLGINSNDTHWQGVIAGVHQSGAPILWGGHTVPELPAETVAALWEEWTGEELFPAARPRSSVAVTYTIADMTRVADALDHIDPFAIEYLQWIGIIAAIKRAFGDEALDMAVAWAGGKPGEVEGKWAGFTDDYSENPATLKSVFYLARQGGWVEPDPEPVPLPEGAIVRDDGTVIIKTTPTPEPEPLVALPECTPALCAELRQGINSPEGRALLGGIRNREVYVAALEILVSLAPEWGGWTFDKPSGELGEALGKSRMSAYRNLHTMDRIGIVNYRHSATKAGADDAPPMTVDLSPLVRKLLDVTGVSNADVTSVNSAANVTNKLLTTSCNVYARQRAHTCNVYVRYAGGGEFADATMRANPLTKGLHGRTLRNVNAGALNVLDFVASGELEVTRRMLVDELGMTPGSAAGATRVAMELGIATVHKEGRTNVYVFSPDWQKQLDALVPQMVSFLASYRLKIRNVSDLIVEVDRQIRRLGGDPKHLREGDIQAVKDLHTRRKKMIFVRQRLMSAMEAKDASHRPQATPAPKPGEWVGAPRPARQSSKQSTPHHFSEGDLIERRLALYATTREQMAVAA